MRVSSSLHTVVASSHRQLANQFGSTVRLPFAPQPALPISSTGSPTQQHGARTRALHRRQEWRSTFRARGLAWPETPQALFHLLRPNRILHLDTQSDTLTLCAAAQRFLIVRVEPCLEPQLSALCRRRALVKCPLAEQLENGLVVREEVLHRDHSQTVMCLPANQTAPCAESKRTGRGGSYWAGAHPDTTEQLVLVFDQPQSVTRLVYEVEDTERERTQEMHVEASTDAGLT